MPCLKMLEVTSPLLSVIYFPAMEGRIEGNPRLQPRSFMFGQKKKNGKLKLLKSLSICEITADNLNSIFSY